MSIGDALKFEAFNLKDMWKGIKKDPKRIFLGVDPASTWAWNKVLGRNDKPIVNQLGGPTNDRFQRAQDAGINTGTASTLHGVAKGVAGALGGYYAGGALGNIGSGSGGLDAVGSGSYANGALGDAGFGGSSAGVLNGTTGTAAAPTANSGGFNWQQFMKQGMGGGGQQQQQPNDWYAEYLKQQEEQQRQAMVRKQLAALLAQQNQPGPGVTYGGPPA